ncbi:MAG: ABC transporter permease [Acidobacteria bacterium]|nr:ABC transporter permease [Acidobacteriota bacterium]MCA1620354.1 ABC transporter permease [Acidobacteriota bacterium]
MTTRGSTSILEPAAALTDSSGAAPAGESAPPTLPESPLVVIEPGRSAGLGALRDLWHYRELLYFLVWRDLKVRYKQTALGVAWVVMQPLLTTLVFSVFLGLLVRVPSDGVPYPLFVFAAMLPWTFFSGAVATSGNSLVGSSHLITKVYFPRVIIPMAAVGGRLMDFLVSFAVLALMMAFYGVAPTWNLLMLPPLVLLVTLLALGVGMWASASNVRYRDVAAILPVLVQLWMFASPVVYPLSVVPEGWRALYSLNPLVGVLAGFRSAVLGHAFDWGALAFSAAVTAAILAFAAFTFRRTEKHFADLV